ncbi:MAG: carcinine hydrolase/isopenicillin-N N-acyltransferase family protein [Candidatus Hodarchaeales archaeon]
MKVYQFLLCCVLCNSCFPLVHVATACTIITAHSTESVLFGKNEDWPSNESFIWFEPGSSDSFGGAFLGFSWPEVGFWPEAGLNEKGLAFGTNLVEEEACDHHGPRPWNWTNGGPFGAALREAATVSEAISIVLEFDFPDTIDYQVVFADPSGDAAVLSVGENNDLVVTRSPVNQSLLVATNFNLNHSTYPYCERFVQAQTLLTQMTKANILSISGFRSILNATHSEGDYPTTYSHVFDLLAGTISLYYFHDFTAQVELDLLAELAKGYHSYKLSELSYIQIETNSSSTVTSISSMTHEQSLTSGTNVTITASSSIEAASAAFVSISIVSILVLYFTRYRVK